MAVELVTGYSGTEHVSSSEDGARQAGTVGLGKYVMATGDMLAATLENANTVTLASGDVLMNGRHVQLSGSTSFTIPTGSQNQQTSNLLILRYELNLDGTEKVTPMVLTGAPSTYNPVDPENYGGASILDGDSPVDMLLYRVITNGITTNQPVKLFDTVNPIDGLQLPDIGGVLSIAQGGTGSTSAAGAATNIIRRGRGETDFNNFTTNGAWYIESPENMQNGPRYSKFMESIAEPVTNWGVLYVFDAGSRIAQLYCPDTGDRLYYRAYNDGSWTQWSPIISQVDARSEAWQMCYPVGAVYISAESTSPAQLFGGWWEQLIGVYPYFSTDNSLIGRKPGTKFGSDTVTLGQANIPPHTHSITSYQSGGSGAIATNLYANRSASSDMPFTSYTGSYGGLFGETNYFNVTPYSEAFYAWKRMG